MDQSREHEKVTGGAHPDPNQAVSSGASIPHQADPYGSPVPPQAHPYGSPVSSQASPGAPVSGQPISYATPVSYQTPPSGAPVFNQTSPGAPAPGYYQAPAPLQKSTSLVTVAAVLLIALGSYLTAGAVYNLLSFVFGYVDGAISQTTFSSYPWFNVIFGIIADILLIVAGVFALVLSKRAHKGRLAIIVVAIAGLITLVDFLRFAGSVVSLVFSMGGEVFDISSTILFFIPVPYPIRFLFDTVLVLLALAACVVLIMHFASAQKRTNNPF